MLLAVACGDDGADTTPPVAGTNADCDPARPFEAREFDRSVTFGDLERTYVMRVPPGYDGSQAVPLVVLFHDVGQTARAVVDYTKLGEVADENGFVLVVPDGAGSPQRWNSRKDPAQPNDIELARFLIATMDSALCIDASRVYAVGYSNGGSMAMRLACDLPVSLAAVGVVAAVYGGCSASVPLLAFHGTADPIVSYEGNDTLPAVADGVARWAQALACAPDPEISQAGAGVEVAAYQGCAAGDAAVQLYTVDGGGHTWPGAESLEALGPTTQEIDASELLWEFFSQHQGR